MCSAFPTRTGRDLRWRLAPASAPGAVQSAFLRADQPFALRKLAGGFAGPADGFGLFTSALFGRLFEGSAGFHFAENTFALQFFLQNTQSLINIVVADENLQDIS